MVLGELIKMFQCRCNDFGLLRAHKPPNGQSQLRQNFSLADHCDSAAHFFDFLKSYAQILIVIACGDNIMAVVGNACGDGSVFQSVFAMQKSQPEFSCFFVAFHNGKLEHAFVSAEIKIAVRVNGDVRNFAGCEQRMG